MTLGPRNAGTGWKAVILAMICALMLGPLTACDEDVSTELTSGLNAAANGVATTLINAAFLTITPDDVTTDNTGGDTADDDTDVPAV